MSPELRLRIISGVILGILVLADDLGRRDSGSEALC
jgi:hypothetical protein